MRVCGGVGESFYLVGGWFVVGGAMGGWGGVKDPRVSSGGGGGGGFCLVGVTVVVGFVCLPLVLVGVVVVVFGCVFFEVFDGL